MAKIIYLLEADKDIQDIIQIILEENGHQVAISGMESIELVIQSMKPDLIILDNWLIKNREYKLFKKLKAGNVGCHTPIMLTSTEIHVKPIAQKNVDDILNKPFDITVLVEKVSCLLNR